jgi:ATP/ADP translocase
MSAAVWLQIKRMLGEFLREVGVLVIVFAPLESLVNRGKLTTTAIVAIVVVAVPCLLFGMAMGVER